MRQGIEELKHKNPIEAVVAAHGVTLRPSGARMTGLCPFHQDQSPSLVIYPETQSFYCFGCGAGGDVIDFVRRVSNIGFQEAVERLDGGQFEHKEEQRSRPELSLDDRMLLTAACAVYHQTLLETRAAQQYLETRGIPLAVARQCRLGYSDGKSLRLYFERHRMSLKRARELGLLWQDGRETFARRIVVPELRSGECVWMIGRALEEGHGLKYRGLALPKPILGYERVRNRARAFVTEGAFDYLTGVAWGLPICALLGTQVRADRLLFLRRARRVFLVLDRDEPGQQGAAELAEHVGANCVRVLLPDGVKDLNDLGRTPEGRASFLRALKAAEAGESREEAEHVAVEPQS